MVAYFKLIHLTTSFPLLFGPYCNLCHMLAIDGVNMVIFNEHACKTLIISTEDDHSCVLP